MLKLNKRQKVLLFSLCVGHICNGLTDAIQSPFYPSVATSKGVSSTIVGMVFGVYKLTCFLLSPFLGQFIRAIGAKAMLLTGFFTVAVSSISFGLLDYIQERITFIVFSFLIRMVEAFGNSCALTASFSIATNEFHDNMYIVSALETCFAIGLIIAPSLGGILYEVGGFIAPFSAIGSFFVATGIMIYIILPGVDIQSRKSNFNVLHLVRNYEFTLLMLANSIGFFNLGFLNVTLSYHLNQFDLSPAFVGLMYLATGLFFAIFTPIWALVGDKYIGYRYAILMGCTSYIIGYILLGPAPGLPLQPSLGLIIVALSINGIGLGNTCMVSFIGSQKEALNYGLPKDLATYGLVSGLWASFLALGYFIGSTCGGSLLQQFGFRNASMSVVTLNSLLIVANILIIILKKINLVKSPKIEISELMGITQQED